LVTVSLIASNSWIRIFKQSIAFSACDRWFKGQIKGSEGEDLTWIFVCCRNWISLSRPSDCDIFSPNDTKSCATQQLLNHRYKKEGRRRRTGGEEERAGQDKRGDKTAFFCWRTLLCFLAPCDHEKPQYRVRVVWKWFHRKARKRKNGIRRKENEEKEKENKD
jgi:hypothetical protein